jgi:hypothetical protein
MSNFQKPNTVSFNQQSSYLVNVPFYNPNIQNRVVNIETAQIPTGISPVRNYSANTSMRQPQSA